MQAISGLNTLTILFPWYTFFLFLHIWVMLLNKIALNTSWVWEYGHSVERIMGNIYNCTLWYLKHPTPHPHIRSVWAADPPPCLCVKSLLCPVLSVEIGGWDSGCYLLLIPFLPLISGACGDTCCTTTALCLWHKFVEFSAFTDVCPPSSALMELNNVSLLSHWRLKNLSSMRKKWN